MQTTYDQDELQGIAGQDQYNWLERVYGTQLSQSNDGASACLQQYGSTETQQGRLLAFPNVLYVSTSPFLKPSNSTGSFVEHRRANKRCHVVTTESPPSSSKIQPSQATDASSRSGSSTRTNASSQPATSRHSSKTGGQRPFSAKTQTPAPCRPRSWSCSQSMAQPRSRRMVARRRTASCRRRLWRW